MDLVSRLVCDDKGAIVMLAEMAVQMGGDMAQHPYLISCDKRYRADRSPWEICFFPLIWAQNKAPLS
jgi:hypothetical protein